MGQITFVHDLGGDLIKILAVLCINIQKEYDIAPEILNYLINKPELVEYCNFLQKQCYSEMVDNIDTFKDSFDMNSTDITSEEYEKCGHLITSHKNTYISYCNLHKYLHPHPTIPMTGYKYDVETDHPFVTKNNNQIIKERYDTSIHMIYQNFINKMYYLISIIFKYMIDISCDKSIVMITDDLMSDLLSKMSSDTSLFKSKMVYEYIDTRTDTPEKFYYVKVFKLRSI
jgi:hypothetical protein